MKIFVTGGTGFIGSHFLEAALLAGHDVIALRRPGANARIALTAEPSWIQGELDEVPDELLSGIDAFVHLAAQGVSPQKTDWQTAFDINVKRSVALLAQAVRAEIPRIVICGSCFEFGRAAERYDRIPADAPLEPLGPYAASKAAFSMAAESIARQSRSKFSLLRPFNIYGEGQHPNNFWPSLCEAAARGRDFEMTPGNQVRDFIQVGEVAKQFIDEIERDLGLCTLFEKRNLGSGKSCTLAQFATDWWEQLGARGQLRIGALAYREDEIMRFVPETD
jgi:nucleoside-diphosphate-sugar epimerase